jgi:hypothetical protein
MKIALSLLAVVLLHAEPRILDVRKIWDAAPHNAFTDLVRYKGAFYCVFREGNAHVSPDGKLRVLTSRDGEQWTSAALLSSSAGDLRDAKITVTPDNRLMLSGASAVHQPGPAAHQSYVWFSADGHKWSGANAVADPDYWLWRITWRNHKAYGFAYATTGERMDRRLRFYASDDGVKYETILKDAGVRNFPNEHAMLFRGDGTAVVLLRRDPAGKDTPAPGALAGIAKPPYEEWAWRDLGIRIGGPEILGLPDGRCIAAVRLYEPRVRTALAWFDPDNGVLKEFLTLPSAGDTSYAGLVWHDRLLWVSYYSSHEGKTSIYLAKVAL